MGIGSGAGSNWGIEKGRMGGVGRKRVGFCGVYGGRSLQVGSIRAAILKNSLFGAVIYRFWIWCLQQFLWISLLLFSEISKQQVVPIPTCMCSMCTVNNRQKEKEYLNVKLQVFFLHGWLH